jgi:hypothetical protein
VTKLGYRGHMLHRLPCVLITLAGCQSTAPAWPTCLRVQSLDNVSGIREFQYDRDGNPSKIIDRDKSYELLANTTITWTRSEVVEHVVGGPQLPGWLVPAAGRGDLGPHGELVRWSRNKARWTSETVLTWTGAFRDATPYASHEVPFLGFFPEHVPFDTRARTFLSRSRTFEFTGTVVIVTTERGERKGKSIATKITKHVARYERGMLTGLEETGPDGRVVSTSVQRNATGLAVRVTNAEGELVSEHAGEVRDGHLRTWRETAPSQPGYLHERQYDYDGNLVTGYRESFGGGSYTAKIRVTRCKVD